ncbi:putative Holliday junction resolvase, partial [Yersinia pestis PY-93]
MANRTIIAF